MDAAASSHDFNPLYHYQFRVIVLGDSGTGCCTVAIVVYRRSFFVGKSSLLRYYAESRQAGLMDPTVGVDFYARLAEIKQNYTIKLQLYDTAGL